MATATKSKAAAPKAEAKSTVSKVRESVSERASAVRENVTERFDDVRGTANLTAGAAMDFGKAYYAGLTTVSKTLWGFGQEFYGEVTDHAQKTMQAKNIQQVAELQASFMQTRLETSAAHGKEFIDVARVETEKTLKPVIELLDGKRAA
ncbi:MAG: phasin family protein [Rhodobacteraceae bacterium]|nr:phasin family protein [Paracoccaceae bacterium]